MTAQEYYQFATSPSNPRGCMAIAQADTDLDGYVLLGLLTFATGAIKLTWSNGNTATVTVGAGMTYIPGPINRVWDTGTALTDATMLGVV